MRRKTFLLFMVACLTVLASGPARPAARPVAPPQVQPPSPVLTPEVRGISVKWLGHSCFIITASSGTRVLIDPFAARLGTYPWWYPAAEVVLVTHEHYDHNATGRVSGHPTIVRGPGVHRARGLAFRGVAAFHDDQGGALRGPDTLFAFTLDRVRFCHLGDLGQHALTPAQLQALGRIDVLFIPVGGYFTIDAAGADRIVAQIKPRVIIPMHYKTGYTDPQLPISGVGPFVERKHNVMRLKGSEKMISWATLPRQPTVIVFAPPKP